MVQKQESLKQREQKVVETAFSEVRAAVIKKDLLQAYSIISDYGQKDPILARSLRKGIPRLHDLARSVVENSATDERVKGA